MTLAEDLKAAAAEVGASATAARDRATSVIADLRAQLASVQDQLQAAIDADELEEGQLEQALADLQAADALVDSIEPAPAEPEEPTEPEEPAEPESPNP